MKNLKINVIRREDLHPGDYILIRCPERLQEDACTWANHYFKHSKCQVGIITDSMSVKIIREAQKCES